MEPESTPIYHHSGKSKRSYALGSHTIILILSYSRQNECSSKIASKSPMHYPFSTHTGNLVQDAGTAWSERILNGSCSNTT
eukprot:5208814-Amphidinium_carterae.1